MRIPTKKSLTRRLDKICSEIVRQDGFCQRCGAEEYHKLQCCHIFSRANRAVRWDIKFNLICLCAGCHFWGHMNPVLFTEFVRKYLGHYNYEMLKNRALCIKKWTIPDMLELEDSLKRLRREYG